jgi:hypothetical protein
MSSSTGPVPSLADAIERGSEVIKTLVDGGNVRIEDADPRPRKKRKDKDDDVPCGVADPANVTWGVKTFSGAKEGTGMTYDDAADLWDKLSRGGADVLMTKEVK